METMDNERRISTGIDGLDKAIDFLRPGDTVVWQCERISDYMYVATRFVTNVARQGNRIVYIRFADHEEIMDTAALRERGANVEKYELDPRVGFETFAVQVRRSSTGRLKYSQDNLRELQLIRHLLRESNLTIDGAKATLRHNPQEAEQRAEAIAQLKAVRDELVELRQLIEQIERYTSASEVRDRLRQEGLL